MLENQENNKIEEKLSQIEKQLISQIFESIQENKSGSSSSFLQNVNKIFLIPVGLPGMGKTTLSRFLGNKSGVNQNFFKDQLILNFQNENFEKESNRTQKSDDGILTQQNILNHSIPFGNKSQNQNSSSSKEKNQQTQNQFKIEFHKISYDRILTCNQKEYCQLHPEIGIHEAIDIIRDKADRDYLESVQSFCEDQSQDNENINQSSLNIDQNQNVLRQEWIYLDRNNTPDIWQDIQKSIKSAYKDKKEKSYRTILILPEQHNDFNPQYYRQMNPICPQMIYECIKRIFGRKSHDCLSSENKPKVVEVILKFAKLYDGVDFRNDKELKQFFDIVVRLDFLQFRERSTLDEKTIQVLIDSYNLTPPNFQCPSDEVIERCIHAVDQQILIDQQNE